MANRGANGIDGVVSTALGIAASGRRTFALLGDLAFLHDVSGLVNLPEFPCTFIVLDNGGGGIFSFLPQAEALEPDRFELLFGTPPGSDVGDVARGFGLEVHEVTSAPEFDDALAASGSARSPAVLRVNCRGRAENVALHETINQAVRLALGVKVGDGVDVVTRPVGLRNESSYVGVAGHLPTELVHRAVVLVAQRHEVGNGRGTTVEPVHDVVDVGELRVRAPGKAAAFVPAPDLDPLCRTGVPRRCSPCWML